MMNLVTNHEQLKEWCNLHKLEPEDAAKVLGLSRAMMYKYLNGSAEKMRENITNQCLLIDLLPVDIQKRYLQHKLAQKKIKTQVSDC